MGVEVTTFRRFGHGAYRRTEPAPSAVTMIFGVGGGWWIEDADGRSIRRNAFVDGLLARPHRVVSADPPDCIEVKLPPWLAAAWFGAPLASAGDVLDVGDLPRRPALEAITNAINVDIASQQVVDWLSRFARLCPDRTPSLVVAAWSRLTQLAGGISIDRLSRDVGCSPRQLERGFAAATGVTPKTAARLLRFSRAHRLVCETTHSLSEIAHRLRFSDQSHMTREFVRLAGTTPTGLRDDLPAVAPTVGFVQERAAGTA